MRKRFLSLLFAVVMVLMLLPAVAVAETHSGEFGDNHRWHLDTATKVLTISGNGEMPDCYSSQRPPWFEYRDSINSVVIENGTTSIGRYVFDDHDLVTSITIPSSVTIIEDWAFQDCSMLKDISLPDSITYIGQGAFAGCASLESIELPESMAAVEGYLFANCGGLTSVKLGNGVITIGENAFMGAAMKSIELPDSVTRIEDEAFRSCRSLVSITIPKNVIKIGLGALNRCSNVYFLGDAPAVIAADNDNASFNANATLFYKDGTSGWTTPTWNGYTAYCIDDIPAAGSGEVWDIEDNGSIETANKVAIGDLITGQITSGDEDYFAFVIPESGTLTMDITLYLPLSPVYIRVYDENGNTSWSDMMRWTVVGRDYTEYNKELDISSGTYYLYLSGGGTGKYAAKLGFKAAPTPTVTPTPSEPVTPTPSVPVPSVGNGWQKIDGQWRYGKDGAYVTGVQDLVGYQRGGKQGVNTYYFNDDGSMYTGFKKLDGKWCFFGETGSSPTTSTCGQMIKNYYVESPSQGYISPSEQKAIDAGKKRAYRYYFDEDGQMFTGWYNNDMSFDQNGKWRYFIEQGGSPETSRLGRMCRYGMINEKLCLGNNGKNHSYFFSTTGGMMTGKKVIHGQTVMFSTEGVDPETDLLGALIK